MVVDCAYLADQLLYLAKNLGRPVCLDSTDITMVNTAQHVRPAPTVLAEKLAAAVLVHQEHTLAEELGCAQTVLLDNTTVVPRLAAAVLVHQDNTLTQELGRAHNVLLDNTTVVPELAAVLDVQQTVTVV